MLILTIDNSYSKIEGLSGDQEKGLRELLSYQDNPQTVRFSGGYRPKKYLINKHGEFPTGLLYIVEHFLARDRSPVTRKDLRIRPKSLQDQFKLELSTTPYLDQVKAATAAVLNSRGIISMPTGSGKSVVIAMIISQLKVRTLVVVPTLELKAQLTEMLAKTFPDQKKGDIIVENVDALDEQNASGYDCVIIDEFHHSAAKTYRKLNKKAWNKTYYKLGLTATPFRSQDHERLLLESVLSKVIYRLSYQDAVKAGYIVPIEAYYYELPKKTVEGYTWKEVYNEIVVNNKERNRLLQDLLVKLHVSGTSTLCLVKEIKHGEQLTGDGAFLFANGLSGNSGELIAKFNSKKCKVLIGTVGILGEGVDTRPAEFVIIAGLGKSKNQLMQQIGRVLRRYPGKESGKVILLKDKSHKWCLTHFREQVKLLREEYGVEPIKL